MPSSSTTHTSSPGIRLDHGKARHHPVMLDVEGAQRCRGANRARRNQGIEQAQIVREVIRNEIGQGALAVSGGWPDHWQRGDQFQRLPHLAGILGVLNQFHDYQARDRREFRQCGKPREGRGILPLDVNKHVGIEEVHGLFPGPSFRLVAYLTSVRLAIGDLRPRPNDALTLPIGDEFCPSNWQRIDKRPCGEETQHVLSERQPQLGGFSRQFTFQLLWQVQHDTHGPFPFLHSYNHPLFLLPTCTSPFYGLLVCETTQSARRTLSRYPKGSGKGLTI